jgi:hypothetical protein
MFSQTRARPQSLALKGFPYLFLRSELNIIASLFH